MIGEYLKFEERLKQRADRILSLLKNKKSAIVNKFCDNNNDKIGACRFFNNENFTYDDLSQAAYLKCSENIEGLHVLNIQDTTEINLSSNSGNLSFEDKEIGPVGNNINPGFFLHPNLVLNSETGSPLGFSNIHIWNRSWTKKSKNERQYAKQAFNEKESYRWLSTPQASKSFLSKSKMVTVIGDRENDIYDEFVKLPDSKTHLLIRSSINRKLNNSDKKLFEHLQNQDLMLTFDVEIKGNHKRKNRIAKLELRYTKVEINRPESSDKSNPKHVSLYALEVRECLNSCPKGEKPILWRLLTTHKVESIEMAKNCVKWYKYRWQIEELFRILKKKGFEIESSRLTCGSALKKLCVMTLMSALQIMQLRKARDGNNHEHANIVFSDNEIVLLEQLNEKYQGATLKLKNPFKKNSLSWASWIIARIGGWKGYNSQIPPGHITYKRGMSDFAIAYRTWELAISIFNNVEK